MWSWGAALPGSIGSFPGETGEREPGCTPLCSRAPLLLPTPSARRHAAARLQLQAGGSTQTQPTARVLPAVAAALQRHLGQEVSSRGAQAVFQVNSCKVFCFDSALCLRASPPPEQRQRWGSEQQQGQHCGILGLREIKPRGFCKRAFPPRGLGAVCMEEAPTQGQQQPAGFVFPGAPLCSQTKSPAALLLLCPFPARSWERAGQSRGGREAASSLP